ncbi:hypothetical protein GCM10008942_40190 [Rhizomicrobium electricum]|uniref:Secreted protein n=1 Tax=Rhizomicrobium electricum TaxID=480070 RepID=A0ABN1FC87_9PROT
MTARVFFSSQVLAPLVAVQPGRAEGGAAQPRRSESGRETGVGWLLGPQTLPIATRCNLGHEQLFAFFSAVLHRNA